MAVVYRVGNHQPQNIYRGDQYIGVMFSPIDAAAVVIHLNRGIGECLCEADGPSSRNELCVGECCGVGMCSCSPCPTCGATHVQVEQGQASTTCTDAWHGGAR